MKSLASPMSLLLLVFSLLGSTVRGEARTCAGLDTSFLDTSVADAVADCPTVARCVETACGNGTGTMQQPNCAEYDGACLRRAAECFTLQLTNGSAIDYEGPFCTSWMVNATNLLTNDTATRRGACMQVACKALEKYGYGDGTSCTANASRSELSDEEWSASCGPAGSPGGTSTRAYIALPVCMHILAAVLLRIFWINFSQSKVRFLPFVLAAIFFSCMGIAAIEHRSLYGGTVECNAMSAAMALENELPAGLTATTTDFFGECDSSRMEMVGFKGARSAEKCCVPRPLPNTSFQCKGITIVPNLLANPVILTDIEQGPSFAACCPTLDGKTVPVGFAAMTIQAIIGIVIGVLLNLFQTRAVPWIKAKCCCCCKSNAVEPETEENAPQPTEEASPDEKPGNSLQPKEEASPDEDSGKKLHKLFGDVLRPSTFSIIKLVVSFVLNIVSASETAYSASGSSWNVYSTFIGALVNGSFVANLSDLLCTLLVYKFAGLDESGSKEDKAKMEGLRNLLEENGWKGVVLIIIVFLPAFITHWIPGLVAFFPMAIIFFVLACLLWAVILLPMKTISEGVLSSKGDDMSPVIYVLFPFLVFASCLIVNMTFLQFVRFPVNWAMLLYGEAHYPYFTAQPGASSTSQLADFYAAMFNTPFYFLQMSSQSCALLRSVDSAFTTMNTVIMYL